MLAAVQFDAQLGRIAIEIQRVRRQRMLAAEFETVQSAITQQLPQTLFGIGTVLAQATREVDGFLGWVGFVRVQSALTPTPLPEGVRLRRHATHALPFPRWGKVARSAG